MLVINKKLVYRKTKHPCNPPEYQIAGSMELNLGAVCVKEDRHDYSRTSNAAQIIFLLMYANIEILTNTSFLDEFTTAHESVGEFEKRHMVAPIWFSSFPSFEWSNRRG
ncbi:hypothetical protein ACJX0J_029232 [Zea mays]